MRSSRTPKVTKLMRGLGRLCIVSIDCKRLHRCLLNEAGIATETVHRLACRRCAHFRRSAQLLAGGPLTLVIGGRLFNAASGHV